jgi:hypothetical protein
MLRRVILVFVVSGIAVFGIKKLVIEPWACSMRLGAFEREVKRLVITGASESALRDAATRHLAGLTKCASIGRERAIFFLDRASCLRLMGRDTEAQAYYELALRYDDRPEIHLNLGLARAATKHPDAIASLVHACRTNPGWLEGEIADPMLQERVRRVIAKTTPAGTRLLRNPKFEQREGLADRATLTGAGETNSPAKDWKIVNANDGRTLVEMVPSPLEAGRKVMNVRTTARGGILQQFDHRAVGPEEVMSSVLLRVGSGRVSLIAATPGPLRPSVTIQSDQKWQRVMFSNLECRANLIAIMAEEGGEFSVAEVETRAVSTSRCNDTAVWAR